MPLVIGNRTCIIICSFKHSVVCTVWSTCTRVFVSCKAERGCTRIDVYLRILLCIYNSGHDYSGRVVATCGDVGRFAVGDEVFGRMRDGFIGKILNNNMHVLSLGDRAINNKQMCKTPLIS